MSNDLISIIIPAYNAQATISQTINAVLQQDYDGDLEILVVDDGSQDETAQEVKLFLKEYPQRTVKYIYQNNAGPSAARNRGASESMGDVLFFTDSDCVPHRDWIKEMLPHLQKPADFAMTGKISVVAGSYGIANPQNLLARCIHKEILFRHQRLMPEFPKVFGSYNFCIWKDVFTEVGGFDAAYRNASGEDNDLSYKLLEQGHRIYFDRNGLVDHYHPVELKKYLYEQYRHGFWRAKMYRRHPKMMQGDDYTFWKDIVEIPLTILIILLIIINIIFYLSFLSLTLISLLIFLILELWFSIRITCSPADGVFFSCVMLLRAVCRTIGFLFGTLRFFMPQQLGLF